MHQLGQLQENYEEIVDKNAEVIAVFREEAEGVAGLEKSREKTSATFPLVLDSGSEQTGAYSQSGFHTYVINPDGKIVAVIKGNLMKRASAEAVLAALRPPQEPTARSAEPSAP